MAIPTSPYHSADKIDLEVFHDYADCPNGQQIKPQNWRRGTGGLARCGSCERLDK